MTIITFLFIFSVIQESKRTSKQQHEEVSRWATKGRFSLPCTVVMGLNVSYKYIPAFSAHAIGSMTLCNLKELQWGREQWTDGLKTKEL